MSFLTFVLKRKFAGLYDLIPFLDVFVPRCCWHSARLPFPIRSDPVIPDYLIHGQPHVFLHPILSPPTSTIPQTTRWTSCSKSILLLQTNWPWKHADCKCTPSIYYLTRPPSPQYTLSLWPTGVRSWTLCLGRTRYLKRYLTSTWTLYIKPYNCLLGIDSSSLSPFFSFFCYPIPQDELGNNSARDTSV